MARNGHSLRGYTPEMLAARIARYRALPRGTAASLMSPSALKAAQAKPARPLKMGNKFTTVDGIKFRSAKESRRYLELKLLVEAGEITDLNLQARIRCVVNGEKVCEYWADFAYYDRKSGKMIHEDTKSPFTRKNPLYRLKKKLVKACANIDILET